VQEAPVSLTLYAHPFSSYCQKVLVALYENATPFSYRLLGPEDPAAGAEWVKLWPLKKMPVLVDGETPVFESSVIIEHLDLFHPGAVRLVPAGAKQALDVRMMDRVFDNYVMTPMQAIVFDHLRPADDRAPFSVARAHEKLDDAYRWLDRALAGRQWACGDAFSLADCAAAPSLFYADWVHEIDAAFGNLRAYRTRLLARPSFARAVAEARPFRKLFPPGAPDRD
jgi:glutathione S-transferase